jgi:hypothetical protein
LYEYPIIQIKLEQNEFKINGDKVQPTFDFKLKEWIWHSEFLENKLVFLGAKDHLGKLRFKFDVRKNGTS